MNQLPDISIKNAVVLTQFTIVANTKCIKTTIRAERKIILKKFSSSRELSCKSSTMHFTFASQDPPEVPHPAHFRIIVQKILKSFCGVVCLVWAVWFVVGWSGAAHLE